VKTIILVSTSENYQRSCPWCSLSPWRFSPQNNTSWSET